MSRHTGGPYKATKRHTQGGKYTYYTIGLPSDIGELVFDQDLRFIPVLTEEGILFRPIDKSIERPDWV